jgi:hypothetical protein
MPTPRSLSAPHSITVPYVSQALTAKTTNALAAHLIVALDFKPLLCLNACAIQPTTMIHLLVVGHVGLATIAQIKQQRYPALHTRVLALAMKVKRALLQQIESVQRAQVSAQGIPQQHVFVLPITTTMALAVHCALCILQALSIALEWALARAWPVILPQFLQMLGEM